MLAPSVAHRLLLLRGRLRLTQAELAERIGVDQATVSRWESGQDIPRKVAWMRIEEMMEEGDGSDQD